MKLKKAHSWLTIFIALVWLINGLFCKVLGLVPRHKEIVGNIIGHEYADILTILIGIGESILALGIFWRFKPRFLAVFQMTAVAVMNIMELILVPDLLLWGSFNMVFAVSFILIIYYKEFVLSKNERNLRLS